MTDNPIGPYPETGHKPQPIDEHWCFHLDCKKWGCFGFQTRYGIEWYCGEHRAIGESRLR